MASFQSAIIDKIHKSKSVEMRSAISIDRKLSFNEHDLSQKRPERRPLLFILFCYKKKTSYIFIESIENVILPAYFRQFSA